MATTAKQREVYDRLVSLDMSCSEAAEMTKTDAAARVAEKQIEDTKRLWADESAHSEDAN